ncbi:MAG: hypothetical protein R3C11_22545 [Planctomycetaceae bacterium]
MWEGLINWLWRLTEPGTLLPEVMGIKTSFTSIAGPGRWNDAFIVFDYKSETDFKYAGAFVGQDEWVIGHYLGGWNNRIGLVEWEDYDKVIKAGTEYEMQVELIGPMIRFSVDGELLLERTFNSWYGDGQAGVATFKGETLFSELHIDEKLDAYDVHVERFEDRIAQGFYIDRTRATRMRSESGSPYNSNDYLYMDDESSTLSNYFTFDPGAGLNSSFEISMDMQIPLVSDYYLNDESSLILFDFIDEENFKVAGYHQGSFVIGEIDNGTIDDLDYITGTFVDYLEMDRILLPGVDYKFHLEVSGNTAVFSLDGEVLVTHEFDEFLNDGVVGMVTNDGEYRLDNFVVGDEADRGGPYGLNYYEDFIKPTEVHSFSFNNPSLFSYVNLGNPDYSKLQLDASGMAGLGIAVFETQEPLRPQFEFSAEMQFVQGSNRWYDGFVIFDYKNENDFKYAGAFVGQNEWIIGHYQGNWANRLVTYDWSAEGRSIYTGFDYLLHLKIDGPEVTLHVDGELIGTATFSEPVNTGQTGFAATNSVTMFDRFTLFDDLQRGEPATLPFARDTGVGVYRIPDQMIDIKDPARSLQGAIVPLAEPLPESFEISSISLMNQATPPDYQNAYLLFDYKSPTDFKYAGINYTEREWVIGHHLNGVDTNVAVIEARDFDFFLLTNSGPSIDVLIDGAEVTLSLGKSRTFGVDLVTELTGTFAEPVNEGTVGVGKRVSYGAYFDNNTSRYAFFHINLLEPSAMEMDALFAGGEIEDELLI